MQQAETITQPETDYTLVMEKLTFDYKTSVIGHSRILHADCFEWLSRVPENTIHAIVTDPPYGVKEYEFDQIEKRENGNGGIWRIPPSFDGHSRSPLPRFTALDKKERAALSREAMGLHSIGVERYDDYYEMSRRTIPHLAELEIAAENMDKEESNYVDVA